MHSSRMRTTHMLTVWGGGGVSAQPRGRVCIGGESASRGSASGGSASKGVFIRGRGLPNPGGGLHPGGLLNPGGLHPGGSASRWVCIQGSCPTPEGLPNPGPSACRGGVCIWGWSAQRGWVDRPPSPGEQND